MDFSSNGNTYWLAFRMALFDDTFLTSAEDLTANVEFRNSGFLKHLHTDLKSEQQRSM